jgi:hypothetical protein
MPEIRIPKSGQTAFRELLQLDETQFDALINAITKTPPAASPDVFSHHVADNVSTIERAVVERIVDELFSLNFARENWGVSEAEFAKIAAAAAAAQASKKSSISDDQKNLLAARLARLLEIKASLNVTSKALDILTDAERVFYSAKILTDVRPVFDDEGNKIEGAVIMHNLRIHFGQDNDHRDFFVALDTNDIKELRVVLDRADKKAKSLEELLNRAKISYLDITD